MIPVPPGVRVLIATRPVDFRKGADSLATLAQERLVQDPFSGAVLVLRSRRADQIRILVWDGSGLLLIRETARTGCLQMVTDHRRGDAAIASAACRAG